MHLTHLLEQLYRKKMVVIFLVNGQGATLLKMKTIYDFHNFFFINIFYFLCINRYTTYSMWNFKLPKEVLKSCNLKQRILISCNFIQDKQKKTLSDAEENRRFFPVIELTKDQRWPDNTSWQKQHTASVSIFNHLVQRALIWFSNELYGNGCGKKMNFVCSSQSFVF